MEITNFTQLLLNETEAMSSALMAVASNMSTDVLESDPPPERWQTWIIGLGFISLCTFSAPLGILILPCFNKSLYERIMTFLIGLGIGTLSGSCFFIMIPQAFELGATSESGAEYGIKSWVIIGSLYAFFTLDRIIQYIMEFRRRHIRRRVHATTLRRASTQRKDPDSPRSMETTVTDADSTSRSTPDRPDVEDVDPRNELEIAVLNNIVARTFSTRRRIAVVKAVDEIDYVDDRTGSAPHSPTVKLNNEVLRRVNSDVNHMSGPHASVKSHQDKQHFGNELTVDLPKGKNNDEVEVTVDIVEKHMVDKDMDVASIAYIIVLGQSFNNFLDATNMGAAFSSNLMRGISIGISAFSEQLPQELGMLAILVNSGLGIKRTLIVNLIPSILSYAGFVVGVALDGLDQGYDTYIFSLSSGMYLYVFLGTLIPEIRESAEELMKTNLKESFLVTALQFFGIGGGAAFIYFMNKSTSGMGA